MVKLGKYIADSNFCSSRLTTKYRENLMMRKFPNLRDVMDDHQCYLGSIPPKEDFIHIIIFFDFVCSQYERAECDGGYRPIKKKIAKIINEYDQEIPQSQTADNPVAP